MGVYNTNISHAYNNFHTKTSPEMLEMMMHKLTGKKNPGMFLVCWSHDQIANLDG